MMMITGSFPQYTVRFSSRNAIETIEIIFQKASVAATHLAAVELWRNEWNGKKETKWDTTRIKNYQPVIIFWKLLFFACQKRFEFLMIENAIYWQSRAPLKRGTAEMHRLNCSPSTPSTVMLQFPLLLVTRSVKAAIFCELNLMSFR